MKQTLVTGAGGFIGGFLVDDLLRRGQRVRAVDIKPLDSWYQVFADAENQQRDLRLKEECRAAVEGIGTVYNLAADMGGIAYIEHYKTACMLSVLINTHLLMAAAEQEVERFLFASSACVYAAGKQVSPDVTPLREEDAYPAMPVDGYGWEKLFSERLCRHYFDEQGLETRIARIHNCYGPHGAWAEGREKAPAAICRKVIQAKVDGSRQIRIWGNGEQTRSFMYIDDGVTGLRKLMASNFRDPLNIGSDELVTINGLVDIVEEIAGVRLERLYELDAPQGVRGRNSDNTLIRKELGWEPAISLREGLEQTYAWIHDQILSGSTAAMRDR